jgi:hypothetical protein
VGEIDDVDILGDAEIDFGCQVAVLLEIDELGVVCVVLVLAQGLGAAECVWGFETALVMMLGVF